MYKIQSTRNKTNVRTNTTGRLLIIFHDSEYFATGVCVASIVLIIVGVVVSAVSDLMLATIFFNASKQLKEAELNRTETS
jgi:hypothetical protein